MVKKLYVGGLPYKTTEDELKEAFAKAGEVASVSIIKDRFSGQSKGFGFVEMTTEEGAKAAMEMWDGQEFGGRPLKVNLARPMTDRPPRQNSSFRNQGQSQNFDNDNRRRNTDDFGDDQV